MIHLYKHCSTQSKKALHDSDDGSTVIREVVNGSDHVGRVEERLSVRRHQHEATHRRHRWPVNDSDHREPDKEVAREALNRSRHVDHPWPGPKPRPPASAAVERDSGVEEAGEDADVGADVLEGGHDVER